MLGSKTLGRVAFFGLGYLLGTRAGRERYAQIEAGAKAVVAQVRARLAEADVTTSASQSSSGADDAPDRDREIRLGD
ncbi:hypothetical protein [Cellulosimicrobium sp. E-16]|uniref:hypothetical protein n=1 Tax=Cellulosimicrobium sp. E-16 TaxID=3404049 RepID=UPI003CFA36BB